MSTQNIILCFTCKTELNDDNWIPSAKKRGHRTCRSCNRKRLKAIKIKSRSDPIKKKNELSLRQIARLKLRLETILAYGNKCAICDENKILFLTIDHINNNGHKENGKKGCDFYSYLRRRGFPGKGTQLQILCHNCNATKELNLRKNGQTHTRSKISEIYVNQPYNISDDQNDKLWNIARELYAKLSKSK